MKQMSLQLPRPRKTETRLYTDIIEAQEIARSVKIAKKELAEILHNLRDGTHVFSYDKQIITALPCDFPRLLVEWKRTSKVDFAIRNIIVSSLLSAEEKNSGSALFAAGLWCSNCKNFETETKKKSKCTFEEVKSSFDYLTSPGMAKSAAIAVIELGGIGHKVEYREVNSDTTKIEVHEGREIFGHVDHLFGDRVGHSHDLQSCTIFAIDGTVETVASIHQVLENSLETPAVIMAKNFLPDVSNSIAETWKMNRGKCIPFVVSSWGLENFLDLEKRGVPCISQDRGDVISSLKINQAQILSFSTSPSCSIIKVPGERDRTKIVVSVSKTLGGLTGIALDRIKTLVGFARLSARSGVIRWDTLSQEFSSLYSKNLVMPSSSFKSSLRVVESLDRILQELGCMVIVQAGAN